MPEKLKKFSPQTKSISSVSLGTEAFIIKDLLKHLSENILYIAPESKSMFETAKLFNYIAPNVETIIFPAWDTVPYDRNSPNPEIVSERVSALSRLALNPHPSASRVIFSSVGAVLQKLPPRTVFLQSLREIKTGGELNFNDFIRYAENSGYSRVEQVMEKGEYAVRGDILDIFPSGSEYPLRIDLFGNEIEKIRTFNVLNQRTIGEIKSYDFQAASEVVLDENTIKNFRTHYREAFGSIAVKDEIYESVSNAKKYRGMENWLPFFYEGELLSLFDYLEEPSVIFAADVKEAARTKSDGIIDHYNARTEALSQTAGENDAYRPVEVSGMFLSQDELLSRNHIEFLRLNLPDGEENIDINAIPGRDFYALKNITPARVYEDVLNVLKEYGKKKRIICCDTAGSRERIFTILNEAQADFKQKISFSFAKNWQDAILKAKESTVLIVAELEKGFRCDDFYLISEQEILGSKQNRKKSPRYSGKDFISDISSLQTGELIVHIEHGIGRFMGLENISAGGEAHDCLKIIYANDDKLFVPVENIETISRYGNDDENVVLDTLGGAAWEAKKAKVKKKIRELAEKLIAIAARRQLQKAEIFGFQDSAYDEFCARFPYHETDDQLNAISDVMADLGSGVPMDRLICGDVGFGKTEVALRAAFTVAMSGGQVAIIVPTTLLARQHYLNFQERMKGFPLKIGMLSRLTSAAQAKKIKDSLKDGSLDIVIGTHALLSDNIKFSDLSLLIIDEEQHFGVAHKEKLKSLKDNVHVLTLTATPIPRTLQLSLTGVKQLSIIATPPVDRMAARTFVMPFDQVMIKEAIYREKYRGGQTFVVCPRVSDIPEVNKILQTIAPDIKILIAHGQMPVRQLEDVTSDFVDGKGDILLSTTIIESGIDMPSVNTMIVYRADMFGLAQLYQLKGRLGRSKVRGYCYFTIPKQKNLKPLAERRLNILKALDSLGAGFSLASHDMDIRGSGNVLGEEQSGHIKDVGIALYHHMLEEEIMRIKSGITRTEEADNDWSPQIITNVPIIISEEYVRDLGVRLGLYKRIGALKDDKEILDMKEELIDRFGPIPPEVENLLKTVEIKQLCKKSGVERIDAGAKGFVVGFHNNRFEAPEKLIELITRSAGTIKVRPDQKLFVSRNLESYNLRLEAVKGFIAKLCSLLTN